MIGMTVCSGVGAPEQAAPWIDWCYQSEIEPFPSTVLAERFPDAVNLGDMTKFQEWPDAAIDVLVGGTPCQSFSVAGLRKGLDDPRGNLTLTFLHVVKKYMPNWVVYENVPGIIPDKDDALGCLISGLNSLGYAVDCDILDAQFFGLAQRRRRVFLVCHNLENGRRKKTPLFANSAGQFLAEILLAALAEVSDPSKLGAGVSEWPARLTKHGLMPKMQCFGAVSDTPPTRDGLSVWLAKLHKDWGEALAKLGTEPDTSASSCGTASGRRVVATAGEGSSGSPMDLPCLNTEQSWKTISGVLCDLVRSSTTSTATKTITPSTIYTFAQASLSIVQSIINSTLSPANFFDGDGSGLTALRGFIGYARQADSDLFGNIDGLCDWFGFISEAERAVEDLERGLGERASTGTLFSDAEGLRWYPPPRRGAGQDVAGSVVARTCRSVGAQDAASGHLIRVWPADVAATLNTCYADKMDLEDQHELSPSGAPWAVRRLTPTETERLMGFPDGWTAIPWRGKPADQCPDGPRYKACGNSWAVNCGEFIFDRIKAVEEMAAQDRHG